MPYYNTICFLNPAPIFNVILMFIGYAIYNKRKAIPTKERSLQ